MPETKINQMHLAETVCRLLMRDMPDAPLVLLTYDGPNRPQRVERTDTERLLDQWVVKLVPTLFQVSVAGQGQLLGLGLYREINIGGQNDIGPQYDYVNFPDGTWDDPTQVIGDEYVAQLRASVERAVTAVEADHAAKQAASRG